MLLGLHIENIAVIDAADMELGAGFHVLTGETGAGKSILIDSLNMLLGERTARALIRYGEKRALVQGLFRVDSTDTVRRLARYGVAPEEDGTLLIQRELHRDGRNLCRINGKLMTVSDVKAIGSLLVNIHGQHDNQALLDPASHINFLDRFNKDTIRPLHIAYIEWYNKVMRHRKAIAALAMDETQKRHRLDVLEYELAELRAAALQPGEEETLLQKRDRINNAKRLTDALAGAYHALHGEGGSAYEQLTVASRLLSDIGGLDGRFGQTAEVLRELTATLEECARDVRGYLDGVTLDAGDIDAVEERLNVIYTLKRKYGGEVADIVRRQEAMEEEYRSITTSDAQLAQLKKELAGLTAALTRAADALHAAREQTAASLERSIREELAYLDMPDVEFQVEFARGAFDAHGSDRVQFLISANRGQPPGPLSKIVSGGELSRIMLAMKSILADSDPVETLIFDEIDTGVSGRAAQKIGRKIKQLARSKQVLCITHLPSIAALADRHYAIVKHTQGDSTVTEVTLLDDSARAAELARIIGGDSVTDTTLKQARQMIEEGRKMQ